MRPTYIFLVSAFVVLLGLSGAGQTASAANPSPLPQPLVDAVRLAVNTNPEVQAKWAVFLAAESQRNIARGGFTPQIDFNASTGTENRTTPTIPSASYQTNSGKLTLNQILFDGAFTINEFRRLGAATRTRYYELVEGAENVAMDAVKAYIDVLRYRELVELATQNYVEHNHSTLLVEERANAGVGRRVDVEQANGRQALAESNLLTELANLHDASARYLRIVGEKPRPVLPALPEPFRLGEMPADVQTVMRDGLLNNPGLLAATQNVRAAQIATQTSKYAFLPRLDAQAYVTRGFNADQIVGESQAQGAALALSYNLFRGGADRASDKRAGFNADQARDLQDKACRDTRQVLSLAFSDVRSLNERLAYDDRHRLAIEKSREAYRQQFDIGQRTLLDLLDTQNEYFQAARSYTNTRHEQAIAQARVLAAMGQLIAAVGVVRVDMPDAGDEDRPDMSHLCEGTETVVDTVQDILARLNLSRPAPTPAASPVAKKLGSYVVLLPDRNKVVGKVIVEGKGGKQVLDTAQQGVKADGGGGAFAVSDEQLKRDFGRVMAVLPRAPERFVLYFESGSDVLTRESKALLPKILEQAAARPGLDISVVGHTDTSGSEQINEALGYQRATFVTRQLRDLGLKTDALAVESSGKRSLEVATPDNTKEQRNRRVEVILR